MNQVEIIELKQNIFHENEVNADIIRNRLKEKKVMMINVMSSPGSGKTSTLLRIIEGLSDLRIGVLECDIDASVDAETIKKAGAKSVQLHTGGMCHMDACMTEQGLRALNEDELDLIFIENVGNLVCPAEFDTGAHENLCILSVPEGDDKPVKYPLMFEVSETVLINKIDAMKVFSFRKDFCTEMIKKRREDAEIFFVSAKTGEGFSDVNAMLRKKLEEFRNE